MLFWIRCFFFTSLILNLIGCASLNVSAIRKNSFQDDKDTAYIENVPFVRQGFFYCGPASLEAVLKYWERPISQKEIADSIYLKKAKGTFNFEMADFALRKGFFTKDYVGSIEDIGFYLKRDVPVIALQKKRALFSDYHYIVVTGINEKNSFIVANDGINKDAVISFKDFLKRWRNAGNWMLVVASPERVDWVKEPDEYNRLGIIFEQNGNLDLAKNSYLKAISFNPKRIDLPSPFKEGSNNTPAIFYFNLANVYLREKEFTRAIENYKKAAELLPDFADCYNNMAYAIAEEGFSLDEAGKLVKKAIELNPDGKFWYMDTLGMINLKQGHFDEAASNFEYSINNSDSCEAKDLDSIYKHLIEAYIMAGINPAFGGTGG